MRKWIPQLAALTLAVGAAAADPLPADLKIDAQGAFKIDSAHFFLQHFGPEWAGSAQSRLTPDAGYPKRDAGGFTLQGQMPGGGASNSFKVNETITATGPASFRYAAELSADPAIKTNSLALAIDIPTGNPNIGLYVGAEEIALPLSNSDGAVTMHEAAVDQVVIALPQRQIRISGNFTVRVQDNRSYKINTFTIRLSPRSVTSAVSSWKLAAAVELLPPASGGVLPADLKIDAVGNLQIDNTMFKWIHYRPGWNGSNLDKGTLKAFEGYPRRAADRFETAGEWSGFKMATSVTAAKGGGVNYTSRFTADPAVEAETLALVMNVPAGEARSVEVDGKKIDLPLEFKNLRVFDDKIVHTLQFEVGGKTVTISGNYNLMIQDDRKWTPNFVFRISPQPWKGKLTDTTLQLNIKVESPHTVPVDLRSAFNMGFKDDAEEDGKGGWTDQGPDNDLRMIKTGKFSALGVGFNIVNPDDNNGKSCIAMAAGQKKFLPKAEIDLSAVKEPFQYLYLLHASAWTPSSQRPIGDIVVEYPDGSTRKLPVISGRDGGNWWQPYGFSNGAIAWTGENKQSFVGLYLSQFQIGSTPKKVTFVPSNEANVVWLVVGATLGNRKMNLKQIETPSYIVADKDWLPLEYTGDTVKGSALDFSRYVDAPAGKYGPVTINKNGHFSFRDAPEKRVRFFGPNLVGTANYLEKEFADDFVTKAVRLGYNSVRFHHFENDLLDRGASDSVTLNPKTLDQLDYLFAELKKHGIYSCLDLYASRAMRPGDNVKEREGETFEQYAFEMKGLIPISPTAMASWKAFARNLLTHKNPYTGMTWAEDPALYSLNLVNENPLVSVWNRSPQLVPLYEAKYYEYLREKGLDTPENRESRGGLFIQFLNEIQIKSIQEQIRFLRDELHLTALITDLNMTSKFTLTEVRRELEFVDNHQYWDHPSFPVQQWRMPFAFSNLSTIARNAQYPRYLMPTRIFGKPYTVTEFNVCNPNPFRAEAGPLTGGYAGLQDWDGLYRFAWSHSRDSMMQVRAPGGFDIVNDPQAQMAERIIFMLFMREDVSMTKQAFAFTVTPEQVRGLPGTPGSAGNYPDEFTELGLYARIGSLGPGDSVPGVQKLFPLRENWEKELPRDARAALAGLAKDGVITSANNEITLDSKAKTLRIVTPRSEVMTFSGEMAGNVMKLSKADRYQTVALMSLDGKDLKESSSILLLQMPNLASTKMKFANERRSLLESWGELPILLEKSKVEVELTLPAAMKVEALKYNGAPNGEIPAAYAGGKLRFTADTAAKQGGVMVYHLTR